MNSSVEGNGIIYCEGNFGTPTGKTAHGLVRKTLRYRILSVIDSRYAGNDTGTLLDGKPNGIPFTSDVMQAVTKARSSGNEATHFIIGLAPEGGRLDSRTRSQVMEAIRLGLHVDSGLHDFLSEDDEIASLAAEHHVRIRDVRKPPARKDLHFFSGEIEKVRSLKVAVLGSDSAIGKRTTAWILTDALNAAGCKSELVGTGQTAWMQGVRYGVVMDSLVNDFVAGEIEHAVWSCWNGTQPEVIIIEGQGSLMNPAFPGGFEILAAARPDIVLLQDAPARKEYDGFPGYPMHPVEKQIQAIELLSEKPVVAVTINSEELGKNQIPGVCEDITRRTGLPAHDVLLDGADWLVQVIRQHLRGLQL